ncbi:MAG TPA: PEP-CTERM sorting domain-containing protein [Oligoflexia bacterium]|nr:PEP-CTERM sorting domain-containing protein [Oligoflexia bacterium]HMP48069.1 PEP-CTERM sorting domain-containing protein [Oligoflexia bacterium]
MKLKISGFFICLFLFVTSLGSEAVAVPLNVSEIISDGLPLDAFSSNLTRTRINPDGSIVVETDDPTIIFENSLNSNFGILNTGDVSYRHDLTWFDPAASSFISMTLTISAFGVAGSNDIVFAETLTPVALINGTLGTAFFSTTVINNNDPLTLNGIFAEGYLNIYIDKNASGGFLAGLNSLSVYSSRLDVQYDSVPEPATMFLIGSGLVFGLSRKKKVE